MIKGIDVSHYQQPNSNLAQSGLGFAFIKATQAAFMDASVHIHANNIGASHLLRGFYHFFIMAVDPIVQAQKFWDTIQPYMDDYSLPPVLDLEDPKATGDVQAAVQKFLNQLEGLSGIKPIIYTGKYFMAAHDLNFSSYGLWDASYGKNPATPYSGWEKPLFWQFTDKSKVEGEVDLVDGDLFLGDAHELGALIKSPTFKGGLDSASWVTQNKVQIF